MPRGKNTSSTRATPTRYVVMVVMDDGRDDDGSTLERLLEELGHSLTHPFYCSGYDRDVKMNAYALELLFTNLYSSSSSSRCSSPRSCFKAGRALASLRIRRRSKPSCKPQSTPFQRAKVAAMIQPPPLPPRPRAVVLAAAQANVEAAKRPAGVHSRARRRWSLLSTHSQGGTICCR